MTAFATTNYPRRYGDFPAFAEHLRMQAAECKVYVQKEFLKLVQATDAPVLHFGTASQWDSEAASLRHGTKTVVGINPLIDFEIAMARAGLRRNT